MKSLKLINPRCLRSRVGLLFFGNYETQRKGDKEEAEANPQ